MFISLAEKEISIYVEAKASFILRNQLIDHIKLIRLDLYERLNVPKIAFIWSLSWLKLGLVF